jgi:crossover junction endodeoxyribonuclease RuvC
MILIGLDPGLNCSGWGVIALDGTRLRHVANGCVRSRAGDPLASRLVQIYEGLRGVIGHHRPEQAAVEETFVNANPQSTLKLGQARGVVLLAAAGSAVAVSEYAPGVVKKSVVGTGAADKQQVRAMVLRLLGGPPVDGEDAADALAVAITHAHHFGTAGLAARVRA